MKRKHCFFCGAATYCWKARLRDFRTHPLFLQNGMMLYASMQNKIRQAGNWNIFYVCTDCRKQLRGFSPCKIKIRV